MGRLGFIGLSLPVLQILLVCAFAQVSEEPALWPVALKPQRGMERLDESKEPSIADRPVSSPGEATQGSDDLEDSQAPMVHIRKLAKHHSDSSMAGGEVIMGGLLTATIAAVFCYIRVTRKRHSANATGDHVAFTSN